MLHPHRTHTPLDLIRLCVVVDSVAVTSGLDASIREQLLQSHSATILPVQTPFPSPPSFIVRSAFSPPKNIRKPFLDCSTMSSDKKSSSRPPSYSGSSNDPFDSKSQSSTKSPNLSAEPDRPRVNRSGTGKRAFSAYAQTWIGMTPVWLMGEALIPGVKVGTTFKGGARKLLASGEEILEMIGASKCVVFALAACLVLY